MVQSYLIIRSAEHTFHWCSMVYSSCKHYYATVHNLATPTNDERLGLWFDRSALASTILFAQTSEYAIWKNRRHGSCTQEPLFVCFYSIWLEVNSMPFNNFLYMFISTYRNIWTELFREHVEKGLRVVAVIYVSQRPREIEKFMVIFSQLLFSFLF